VSPPCPTCWNNCGRKRIRSERADHNIVRCSASRRVSCRDERAAHTSQPTALVHEACLKLPRRGAAGIRRPGPFFRHRIPRHAADPGRLRACSSREKARRGTSARRAVGRAHTGSPRRQGRWIGVPVQLEMEKAFSAASALQRTSDRRERWRDVGNVLTAREAWEQVTSKKREHLTNPSGD